MAVLKIVYLSGDRQIVLYGQDMKQMWQVESHILERLGEQERQELATAQFRKFWIDDEGDRVEIINDVDFDFFIKQAGSKTPKIYFEARHPPNKPQTSDTPLSIHTTVECDVCKIKPIVGFRYKCMQCPNYDLCMQCEGEMKHSDHLMLRIPTAGSSANFESLAIFNSKRRNRKHVAAAVAADGLLGESKSRHHRSHRRHCTGAGLFSNFYDMMQDLAEGGVASEEAAPTAQNQNQQEATPPAQATSSFEEIIAAAAAAASATTPVNASLAAKAAAVSANDAVKAATAASSEAARAAAANAVLAAMSMEPNTSERNATTTNSAQSPTGPGVPVSPSLENLQNLIDPKFMKAGIQILNNFSEMFGKILDPAVIAENSRSSTSRSSTTPEPSVVNIDLTGERPSNAASSPAASGTPITTDVTKISSQIDSGKTTPMETEASPQTSINPDDWTMIDTNTTVNEDLTKAASASASQAPPFDFAKVSQLLKTHVEEQKKKDEVKTSVVSSPASSSSSLAGVSVAAPSAPAVVSVTVPTTSALPNPSSKPNDSIPVTVERRAIAVFHPDARINSSIHAMMAMGFSNEGAVLTQLLESVNGSIPLALDLMAAAQRN